MASSLHTADIVCFPLWRLSNKPVVATFVWAQNQPGLTPWCSVIPQKLTAAQSRNFLGPLPTVEIAISVFVSSHHWNTFWVRLIQFTSSNPTSWSIVLSSRLSLSFGTYASFLPDLQTKMLYAFIISRWMSHALTISSSSSCLNIHRECKWDSR